jgi:hypothetical protein
MARDIDSPSRPARHFTSASVELGRHFVRLASVGAAVVVAARRANKLADLLVELRAISVRCMRAGISEIAVRLRYTRNDLLIFVNCRNSLIRCILLPSPPCAYFTSIYLRTWFRWQTHNPLVPCSTHGRPTI